MYPYRFLGFRRHLSALFGGAIWDDLHEVRIFVFTI